MYSIMITSYCNPEYLKLCVDSILENSYYDTNQICIHINGYDKDSIEYLNRKGIIHTMTEANIGISAINLCVDRATFDNVLLANDDCYFTKNWDRDLHLWEEELNAKFPDYRKIIGYRWCEPLNGSFLPICNAGKTIEEFDINKLNEYVAKYSKHEISKRWLFNSLYPRDVFFKCRYSPEFYPASGMDSDFMMKVLKYFKDNNEKFLIFGIDDCCVYHFQGRASKKNKLKIPGKDNSKLYMQKWGVCIKDTFNMIDEEVLRSIATIEGYHD